MNTPKIIWKKEKEKYKQHLFLSNNIGEYDLRG